MNPRGRPCSDAYAFYKILRRMRILKGSFADFRHHISLLEEAIQE